MQKIKHFIQSEKGKDVLIISLIILVGIGSFELGRLSKDTSGGGIKIEYSQNDPLQGLVQEASAISALPEKKEVAKPKAVSKTVKNFVASSRGSKYYPVDCAASKNLKPENRIYFNTKEEAEGAGYTPSASCR